MYYVIRVKLKINVFYVKEKCFDLNIEVKMVYSSDGKFFLFVIRNRWIFFEYFLVRFRVLVYKFMYIC